MRAGRARARASSMCLIFHTFSRIYIVHAGTRPHALSLRGGAELGDGLDLDQRLVLDEAGDDDHGHRREVPAHDAAVGLADLALAGEVLPLVGDVPGQAHDVLDVAAGGAHDRGDVGQRLLHLADEVAGLEHLVGVPADLAADVEPAASASTPLA